MKTRSCVYFFIVIAVLSCKERAVPPAGERAGKVDELISEAMDSLYANLPYSRHLLQQAMQQAPDSLSFHEALNTYAFTCFVADRLDSARTTAQQVQAYTARQNPSDRIYILTASSHNMIGNCYAMGRKQDSALYHYLHALNYYELTSEREKAPDVCMNIADMYMKKGDFANSAQYYRKALFLSDSLGITGRMGFPIYTGLAQLYMELRDFDLSDHYFRLAENQYEERPLNEKFFFCNTRGNYYFFKEEYRQALPWFEKAKTLVTAGGYGFSIHLVNINLGEIYFHLNKPDSALDYLNQAQAYFSRMNEPAFLYHIGTIRAGIALKEDNPAQARRYLQNNGDTIRIEPNLMSIRNRYMQDYFARTGDFEQAYAYLQRNKATDDSIRSERTRMRIAEMDMRYVRDTTLMKKELFIQGQAAHIESLRMRSFIWVMACLLIMAVAGIVYVSMKKQKDLQWMIFHDQMAKLRLTNIRNRISPHFIFNALNREISSAEDPDHSNLKGLVFLLRRSLEMTDRTHVTLFRELEFAEAYIKLEQESLGDDFRLEWQIDPHVDTTAVSVPPMIIQIPVENAMKHALRQKEGEKKLSVRIKKEENGVGITIQDNGPGYFPGKETSSAGTGTGLKVLYQSIDVFNAKNKEKILFHIGRSDEKGLGGAKVTVFIPDNYVFK
ncbi:histidine kinase [Limibacterium fermenti]|uniref:tetratricopeptide repeat-containing sensor histidine kinase n=1 Tax=Limibacterium fermenti TaxID=3229863 RepID=UPI000E98AE4E|nr:sensor histidine kinase [Porphyromonadaceae bacterium]